MLTGKNILCFGSENWEYPGFQQTIMRKLSASNRVIFVNPLGSRKIRLQLSQLSIYWSKMLKTFAKQHTPTTNCLVCSPKIIPLVYNRFISCLNRQIIKRQLGRLLIKHDFKPYILWVGTPTAAFLMDLFDPELLVYHAVDKYSAFTFVDSKKILQFEKIIAEKADVILCTADEIRKDLLTHNKKTYTVTHGVDTNHFKPDHTYTIPQELKEITKPMVGFIGGLADWVDYPLLYRIAQKLPDICLVLIGKKYGSSDIRPLEALPNVRWLGYKNFSTLPSYLNMFSVCLIPYVINERLLAVDPIKLREYLAMGKPVVSVDLPEVRKLNGLVYIGKTVDEFVEKIKLAICENNPQLIKDRISVANQSNWKAKIEEISSLLQDTLYYS